MDVRATSTCCVGSPWMGRRRPRLDLCSAIGFEFRCGVRSVGAVAPAVVDVWLGAHHDSGLDSSILRGKTLDLVTVLWLSLWYDLGESGSIGSGLGLPPSGGIRSGCREARHGKVEDTDGA